ncbi:MAG TPA: conjugal transfer protein TraH [Alphaproteobacteria bacterium]|nr:conjugal transfer protein TraH [Alphaproteobacteria bacterium]
MKNISTSCFFFFLFSWVLSPFAQANVNTDLTQFFNKLGGASNMSRSCAYQDQTAGYYTGGNLFARNQVHSSQLATIQLPDYRAGCGGIDMFMGAISHISSARLIEALKAIGSNMGSYALLLAIETMSPQVKNIMTELNDLVQKINQSNINSCELAATTLGSVWPKSDASKRHLCKMIGTDRKYGGFSDYSAARQECGAGNKTSQVLGAGEKDPRFARMLGTEFNLAWKAIQENDFLRKDKDLAQFFMSLSGTIISKREDSGSYSIQAKVSLAHKDTLLSALLHGGRVMLYRCSDPDKCLNVQQGPLEIKSANSLLERVKALLGSIENKIYMDEPLSKEEIAFLNSTRLPFYKIINVSTAYRRGGSPIDILDYAELGAIDILFQYLSEILDVILESIDHIRLSQIDDAEINLFQKSLQATRSRIIEKRMGSFKQIEQVISIVHKTELLEKSLMSKVGSINAEDL